MKNNNCCFSGIDKGLATICAALICMYLMKLTNGENGIG